MRSVCVAIDCKYIIVPFCEFKPTSYLNSLSVEINVVEFEVFRVCDIEINRSDAVKCCRQAPRF
jgi:predicted DNA-binding protein (UPF0251 family)